MSGIGLAKSLQILQFKKKPQKNKKLVESTWLSLVDIQNHNKRVYQSLL